MGHTLRAWAAALCVAAVVSAWLCTSAAAQSPGATAYATPPPAAAVAEEERTNWALIAPGIGLLAGGYALNVVTGLLGGVCLGFGTTSCPSDEGWGIFRAWSLAPLIGPWAQLAAFPGPLGESPGWIAWLVTTGALQAVGLTLLVVGIATPRHVTRPAGARVEWLPALGPGTASVLIHGSF